MSHQVNVIVACTLASQTSQKSPWSQIRKTFCGSICIGTDSFSGETWPACLFLPLLGVPLWICGWELAGNTSSLVAVKVPLYDRGTIQWPVPMWNPLTGGLAHWLAGSQPLSGSAALCCTKALSTNKVVAISTLSWCPWYLVGLLGLSHPSLPGDGFTNGLCRCFKYIIISKWSWPRHTFSA